MTERCTHCNATGKVTVQSRCYEYPTFEARCYVCNGSGFKSPGLDIRGERQLNAAEHRVRVDGQTAIDDAQVWGPVVKTGPFADEFGLGQERVASIRLELAEETLMESVIEAFSTGYENDEWRAMRRRQFDQAMIDAQRARDVLAFSESYLEAAE